jgi:hypothetical protein
LLLRDSKLDLVLLIEQGQPAGQPNIIVHSPGEQLSMVYQYWTIPPKSYRLRRHTELGVFITLQINYGVETSNCNPSHAKAKSQFFQCVLQQTQQAIYNATLGSIVCGPSLDFGNCTTPHVSCTGKIHRRVHHLCILVFSSLCLQLETMTKATSIAFQT